MEYKPSRVYTIKACISSIQTTSALQLAEASPNRSQTAARVLACCRGSGHSHTCVGESIICVGESISPRLRPTSACQAYWSDNSAPYHGGGAVQDSTARVWDVRMAGAGSVAVLRGRMGAVRSLRFSPSGAHLAVAEPADFVTLFDVASGFQQAQEVTFCLSDAPQTSR